MPRSSRAATLVGPNQIDQLGTDGIPMGLHWLEVAEGLEHKTEPLRRRFEENYFEWRRDGDEVRIKGSLSYALICGEKRLR